MCVSSTLKCFFVRDAIGGLCTNGRGTLLTATTRPAPFLDRVLRHSEYTKKPHVFTPT
jgi:hypothetical protein